MANKDKDDGATWLLWGVVFFIVLSAKVHRQDDGKDAGAKPTPVAEIKTDDCANKPSGCGRLKGAR